MHWDGWHLPRAVCLKILPLEKKHLIPVPNEVKDKKSLATRTMELHDH